MGIEQKVMVILISFVTLVWYIRPLYNYMAIRKYVLLDKGNLSIKRRFQSGLPALLFYVLILGLLFYPAITNKLLNLSTAGSVIAIEIVIIFILSRYDKIQTKYKIHKDHVQFRRRTIYFKEEYTLKFKKSFFIVLHKPRFILKSNKYVIVIPLLSKNITDFIKRIDSFNHDKGTQCMVLYQNIRNYHIQNIDIIKEINK